MQTVDGSWHEVSAEAFFEEYAQRDKNGNPTIFWKTKGMVMLEKCAEAKALRRAFPSELSGIYTKEEMEQEDNPKPIEGIESKKLEELRINSLKKLSELIEGKKEVLAWVLKTYKAQKLSDLSADQMRDVIKKIEDKRG